MVLYSGLDPNLMLKKIPKAVELGSVLSGLNPNWKCCKKWLITLFCSICLQKSVIEQRHISIRKKMISYFWISWRPSKCCSSIFFGNEVLLQSCLRSLSADKADFCHNKNINITLGVAKVYKDSKTDPPMRGAWWKDCQILGDYH